MGKRTELQAMQPGKQRHRQKAVCVCMGGGRGEGGQYAREDGLHQFKGCGRLTHILGPHESTSAKKLRCLSMSKRKTLVGFEQMRNHHQGYYAL